MSADEYAALEQQFGAKLSCVEGVWWRRVRPLFYRPLLSFQAHANGSIRPPGGWPVGFQYVLDNPQTANSTMNWLLLDQLSGYSLEKLSHNRRRLIKNAGRTFHVKPITHTAELQTAGYAAYLSFYARTRYRYRRDRTRKRHFDDWAARVSEHPKTIVLGGYDARGLKAVSVSYRVGDTLIYATFFGDSLALKKNLGETMFHELRQSAAQQSGLTQIIVRNYQGGTDHDRYYLIRGCRLVRKPARLAVTPPLLPVLRFFSPGRFARLVGNT